MNQFEPDPAAPESPAEAPRAGAIFALALLAAALLSFPGLGRSPISLHDEGRVAGIGREMLDTFDLVVPRLNGHPFLEKPPLYWWTEVAAMKALGVSDLSARLPSGLFCFLTLLLVFAAGRRLGGAGTGLAAMLVAGTTADYFDVMHRALVDPALVFTVMLGVYGFLVWLEPDGPRSRRVGGLLWAAAIPLSWLAKGVAGPGFTLGAPVLYLLAARRFRDLRAALWVGLAALVVSVLLIGPWLLALGKAGGPAWVREVALSQTFSRLFGGPPGAASHAKPFWWYLVAVPGRTMPWILALPAAIAGGAFARTESGRSRRALLGLFLAGLLLLSASTDKRGIYLTPLYPILALPVGWWLASVYRSARERRLDRITLGFFLTVLALVPAAVGGALAAVRFFPIHSRRMSMEAVRAGLGTPTVVVSGVVGLALTVLLVRKLLTIRRTGARVPVPLVVGLLAACLLGYQIGLKPLIARTDTPRPLTSALARAVPAGESILAFKPRESLEGIVYFDLGRHLLTTSKPEQAASWLAEGMGSRLLLLVEDEPLLPAATRDRLRVEFRETHRVRHPYEILATKEAGEE